MSRSIKPKSLQHLKELVEDIQKMKDPHYIIIAADGHAPANVLCDCCETWLSNHAVDELAKTIKDF